LLIYWYGIGYAVPVLVSVNDVIIKNTLPSTSVAVENYTNTTFCAMSDTTVASVPEPCAVHAVPGIVDNSSTGIDNTPQLDGKQILLSRNIYIKNICYLDVVQACGFICMLNNNKCVIEYRKFYFLFKKKMLFLLLTNFKSVYFSYHSVSLNIFYHSTQKISTSIKYFCI
jgi:hypothetical protein